MGAWDIAPPNATGYRKRERLGRGAKKKPRPKDAKSARGQASAGLDDFEEEKKGWECLERKKNYPKLCRCHPELIVNLKTLKTTFTQFVHLVPFQPPHDPS